MTTDPTTPDGSQLTPASSGSRPHPAVFIGIAVVAIVVIVGALIALSGSSDDADQLAIDDVESSETTLPSAIETTLPPEPVDDPPAAPVETEAPTTTQDSETVAPDDSDTSDSAETTDGDATESGSGPAIGGPAAVVDDDDAEIVGADRGAAEQVETPTATETAVYQVSLDVEWTDATHPVTLPPNAHFSDPIVAVHSEPGAMFALGTAASPGIEAMAERGSTGTLVDELRASGLVTDVQTASDIPFPAIGSRTFEVAVTQSVSRVSLVSMLAPTPDWFVGIDESMFVDGQWVDSMTVTLGNYDSGTDSGPDFTSDNADTQPRELISGPQDASFVSAVAEGAFGTVTFTRIG